MIHTARQNAKFVKLVRRLRPLCQSSMVDVETIAVGILERLWHGTTTSAPRGDIGRLDDDVIAELCGWHGEPKELIEILTECGWLDCSDEHRLLVHDWADHAPGFVKGNVTKQGGFFLRRNSAVEEIGKGQAQPIGPASKDQPIGPAYTNGVRARPVNLTKPNLTKPNPLRRKNAAGGGRQKQKKVQPRNHHFDAVAQASNSDPRVESQASYVAKFSHELRRAGYTPEQILEAGRLFETQMGIRPSPSALAKWISRLLNGERIIREPPNGQRESTRQRLERIQREAKIR